MEQISVIVNCHNGEKYLDTCIKSIIDQTYKNFEIIFFDNSSSDNSKSILKKFKDERIKYFYSKKKLSLYGARNEALKKTSGELIAFLDVDDWWDDNYLNSRREFFINKDYDIFYNNVFLFNERNKKIKRYKNYQLPVGKIYDFLARDYFIIISGLIIRKSVFDQIGEFNSNFDIIGDFDFVMRASKKFNFHSLDEPMTFYRVHPKNFSKINIDLFYEEFFKWYQSQIQINDQYFIKNQSHFKERLLFLEINYLLLNEKKNFLLFKKILEYPNFLQMLKFIIGFFLPKKIIKIFKK